MLLQNIISQSQFSDDIFEEQPSTDWTGVLDGNYPSLTINKATVFIPTTTDVDTYNHHQQAKQYYGDDIHLIWSTHEADEIGYGSRIRYSKSTDNGLTWSTPVVLLVAQDDSTKDYTTLSGRQSIACGLTSYNNELYAIVSVDELGANASYRTGIGMLAIKINSNATFGTPVWIDTPQSNFVAPSPVATYPSYSFDTTLRTNLRNEIILNLEKDNMVSYFATSVNDPLYVRLDYLSNTMAEPVVGKLPNGQFIKLWKDGNTSTADYKVAQTSTNKITWNDPYITAIPDINARTRILLLNSNEVSLVGNNQATDASRDPLYFALSIDGVNYTSDNIYNIDVTTYSYQFSGQGKGRGAQHPTLLELNNGKICVCYSWNKEEVYCATFDKPTLV